MIRLRKYSKEEILYNMFPEVGDSHSVDEVISKTGSNSLGALKTMMTRLRDEDVYSKEQIIHLSMKNNQILRIK